ncbi:MAG: hypothetical protein MTP17_03260 [Candidatus Midichloria sp.]|nr:MAG: hypothetical protein MTP17_03260 [Candidatus Midichloria sp.]
MTRIRYYHLKRKKYQNLFNKKILSIIEKHMTYLEGMPQELVIYKSVLCDAEDVKHISTLE